MGSKLNCSNCGALIDPDSIFCVYCGNQLKPNNLNKKEVKSSIIDESAFMNVFLSEDWENRYKSIEDASIILTNTAKLKNKDDFLDSVDKFILNKKNLGINYIYLDLANQMVDKKVAIEVGSIEEKQARQQKELS